jgi:hypothetical protein
MDTAEKFATSTLSKKRYDEIKHLLEDMMGERAEEALAKIRDIMKFDPEQSTYTKERGKAKMEARKKRAEELGMSVYEYGGMKASYERKSNLFAERV